jgi:hypothetical protein
MLLQFVRQYNKPPAAGDLRTRPNPYVDLFAGGTAGGGAAAAAAGKAVFGKAAQQQQPGGGFGTGALAGHFHTGLQSAHITNTMQQVLYSHLEWGPQDTLCCCVACLATHHGRLRECLVQAFVLSSAMSNHLDARWQSFLVTRLLLQYGGVWHH